MRAANVKDGLRFCAGSPETSFLENTQVIISTCSKISRELANMYLNTYAFSHIARLSRYMYLHDNIQQNLCKTATQKIDKTKIFMTNRSLMKVENIAEYSPRSILQYF